MMAILVFLPRAQGVAGCGWEDVTPGLLAGTGGGGGLLELGA
jgi:hypothetical protein